MSFVYSALIGVLIGYVIWSTSKPATVARHYAVKAFTVMKDRFAHLIKKGN